MTARSVIADPSPWPLRGPALRLQACRSSASSPCGDHSGCGASAVPDEADEVRDAARELSEAIVSNDASRIGEHLSEDWRLIDADGVTTRRRFLELVMSGSLTHSRMHAVGDIDVRLYGDVGVALARVVNTAHFGGETFEADEWTTDVFIRSADRWLCAHSHVTPAA